MMKGLIDKLLKEKPKINENEDGTFTIGFDTKYSDELYDLKTNCINCVAPLHHSKCEYCGTEYTIDNCGKIDEYKVKLNLFGQDRNFYIRKVIKHDLWASDTLRGVNGNLVHNKITDKIELVLIEM